MAKAEKATGLAVKSVRDRAQPGDGERILVDRLWPRGVSKNRAHLTEWLRDVAPSTELRRWFAHDPAKWAEFRKRYMRELQENGQIETLRQIGKRSREQKMTLLFGAHDPEHNNAVALADIARHL